MNARNGRISGTRDKMTGIRVWRLWFPCLVLLPRGDMEAGELIDEGSTRKICAIFLSS